MSPLQRIAMGMLIVAIPADFPHDPHPAWRFYDALPDPVGWLLVLWGMWGLGRHLDVDWARWAGVVALAISVPLWFPQVNHHIALSNPHVAPSVTWGISLPPFLFGLALSRAVSRAAQLQEPRDAFVAGRFGVLMWAFAASAVLPVVGYNLPLDPKTHTNPTLSSTILLIGLVQLVFVYYLFRVHRRVYLGGPGPLEIHPKRTNAAPEDPERRS